METFSLLLLFFPFFFLFSFFILNKMETYAYSSTYIKKVKSVDKEEIKEKVYIAVKEDFLEGKHTLLWVLQKLNNTKMKMVFIHVYIPGDMTSTMKSNFPASKEGHVLKHYSKKRETMHKKLNAFTNVCTKLKVQSEILVIEADDVAEGLIELISLHGIAKLVMGAASDKHFTKKMNMPKSKTAIRVRQQADPACKIWFVCNETLICTREAFLGMPSSEAPSILSFLNSFLFKTSMPGSRLGSEIPSPSDSSDGTSKSFQRPYNSFQSTINDDQHGTVRNSSSVCNAELEQRKKERMQPQNEHYNEVLNMSSPNNVNVLDSGLYAEVYDIVREARTDAENWKHKVHNELLKRQKAEKVAEEASRRANISENNYANEASRRKEVEELLASQQMEAKTIINQRDEVTKELQNANKKKLELEIRIYDYDYALRSSEEKVQKAQQLYDTLKVEHEKLQQQSDATLKEVRELRRCQQVTNKSGSVANFSKFSFLEIELATHNFSDSLKIGEGGYGSVYKGFLRNTTVAIKVLNCESMQGQSEFHQEVNVLSMVRHPNLITLIGVCSEIGALIYEYLPNGSLDDRLDCKDNTLPLTWQTRTRICTEICSALIFLHSNKPHPIVHGDLKPENILLDANLTSKLGDFGICRLLTQSSTSLTCYHRTLPKGTYAYMDVEFLRTGELTPQSDVYSFGIVVLRLLTGKQAIGIVKEVKEALDKNTLHEILDSRAGDWPFLQAKQLARLGLRCCEINRRKRPHLVEDVWRVLLSVMKVASKSVSSFSIDPVLDDNVPNHFICPIYQEIMTDPHVASDGFTYEAEALKGWIESGHNTSPMTNLTLPSSDLIPNRALRSAIQEWLQHQHQSL